LAAYPQLRHHEIWRLGDGGAAVVAECYGEWRPVVGRHALRKGTYNCEALMVGVTQGDFGEPQIGGTLNQPID
jgi:hypothetical protein